MTRPPARPIRPSLAPPYRSLHAPLALAGVLLDTRYKDQAPLWDLVLRLYDATRGALLGRPYPSAGDPRDVYQVSSYGELLTSRSGAALPWRLRRAPARASAATAPETVWARCAAHFPYAFFGETQVGGWLLLPGVGGGSGVCSNTTRCAMVHKPGAGESRTPALVGSAPSATAESEQQWELAASSREEEGGGSRPGRSWL